MNRLYVHIVWLFLVFQNVSAQTGTSVSFTSGLSADKTHICPGGSVKLSVSVSNAGYFQFQFKEAALPWQNLPGAGGPPATPTGDLSLDLQDVHDARLYRVMITDTSSADTLYSNELAVSAQKTEITQQPQSLIQCNGSGVEFRSHSKSSGPLVYQWQILKNGAFTDLVSSSKIPDVQSENLKVNSLTNAENGGVYRCKIVDQGGCTIYTSEAGLSVNQLSTTIQPTLSEEFCEGDDAEFFPASVSGEVLSYQWLIKSGSSYVTVSESSHFSGVNSDKLTVKGILSSENAFQIKVTFRNLLQGADGSLAEGSCSKTATRTGYLIHPRPGMPAEINQVERCGPGTVRVSLPDTSGSYSWYEHPEPGTPLTSGTSTFNSPVISSSTSFYVSTKDDKGCESLRREFKAIVHQQPSINLKTDYEACPGSTDLLVDFGQVEGSPDQFSLTAADQALTGFNPLIDQPFSGTSPLSASLPPVKSPGTCNFYLQLKNTTNNCVSDHLKINLTINDRPEVVKSPASQTLCEENTLKLTVEVSGGGKINYQWLKDSQNLAGQNTAEMVIGKLMLQDAGQYRCIISSDCGSDTSEVAVIKVLPKIQILRHPENREACEGGKVSFTASATGSAALHYQWMKNGQAVGADTSELVLSHLDLADNNASVWCEIKDACDQVFKTNAASLSVLKLPEPPRITGKSGYCKGETAQALTAMATGSNFLKWYVSDNQNETGVSTAFVPDCQSPGKQYFYVSQTDLHQCESKKAVVEITVSAPLSVNITSSTDALCTTGNLNRDIRLKAEISTEASQPEPLSYSWKFDSTIIQNQVTNEISIHQSGKYQVYVTQGFCSAQADIQIQSIHPELSALPSANNTEVCPGGTATLLASGGSGNYSWWDSETGNNQLSAQNPFVISGIVNPAEIYVSTVKTTGNTTCESPRKKVNIGTIPLLNLQIALENAGCPDKSDGKLTVQSISGKAPFMYSLNSGPFKNDGEFTGLLAGLYRVSVRDSNSCITDKDTVLSANPLPEILTQPVSQTDCKGNSVDFIINASGYTSLQWQKKLPGGSYEDMPGENQTKLKVSSVGSATYPDQTIFRVALFTNHCQISSTEATLSVNSVVGTMAPKTICEGTDAEFNLNSLTITGKTASYLWQFRPATTGNWENISEADQPVFMIGNSKATDQGYYRCRIIFDNGNGSTCTTYSSAGGTKLTVISSYIPALSKDTMLCSPQEIQLTAGNCPGKILWSTGATGASIKITPKDSVNSYSASCEINGCTTTAKDPVIVKVVSVGLKAPVISVKESKVCNGEPFSLSASGCQGKIVWSNGMEGRNIEIIADKPLEIYANCHLEECVSEKSNPAILTPADVLKPGEIASSNTVNCAGYNPPDIGNVISPSGGKTPVIIWEMSENCENQSSGWKEIAGAHGLTFNPSTLLKTTCYRRKVTDSCQLTDYSNIVTIHIQQDPVIKVVASKTEICADETATLNTFILGGAGNCQISWQMNEKSGAESSVYWVTIPGSDSVLTISEWKSPGQTIYFRPIYVCELSSCNKSISPSVAIYIRPSVDFSLNLKDTTICSGNFVDLASSNCGGKIKWSTGDSIPQIRVYPVSDQTYEAICSSECGQKSLSVHIGVAEGIPAPVSTTPVSVIMPGTLQFSGTGQHLRWHTSETDRNGFTDAPLHTTAGTYTYWLSQTIGQCQSPKTKITATLYPVLSVVQQPVEQVNCAGNMVTFKAVAEGAGKISYQWQRKRPDENEFIMLTDEMSGVKLSNTSGLKVYSTGNLENPDLSEYRCIIRDSVSEITTASAFLKVNGLRGNFPDFKICTGKAFSLDLKNHFIITGNVKSYQWQYRYGSDDDWQDAKNNDNISGAQSTQLLFKEIRSWDPPRYRCQVFFASEDLNCIENTDQSTLTIGNYPPTPVDRSFEFCQYEKVSKLAIETQSDTDPLWYSQVNETNGSAKMPAINTNQAGEQLLYLSQINGAGCQSNKALIRINVHPQPASPVSTTPTSVFEGQNLTFSAEGENLKWFTSKTGKTYQTNAPIYQLAKTYRHFVSQTSSYNCESERTEITATIRPSLGFVTQPEDQTDCEGNGVTFSVKTKGEEEVSYQWQRKRPGEIDFTDMPGENLKDLKIAKIGTEENPHLSLYRCYIKDSRLDGMSNEVVLRVNEIKNSQLPLEICDNQLLNIDANKLGIIGEARLVEWQKKEGSIYKTVFSTPGLHLNEFMKANDHGDYRLKINFKVDEKTTCSRYTNTFKVKVNPSPQDPALSDIEICQFERTEKISKKIMPDSGLFVWYTGESDTLRKTDIPQLKVDSVYQSTHYVSARNNYGCESRRTRVGINILPAPVAPGVPEKLTYCRFSLNEAIKFNSALPLFWYEDTLSDIAKTTPFIPLTMQEGEFTYAVVSKNTINGCESKRQRVTVKIDPCYYPVPSTGTAECQEVRIEKAEGVEWLYFTDTDARIIAAIHPEGQNLGQVTLSFGLAGTRNYFETDHGTRYIPRYYHFKSSSGVKFSKPVKIRLFMSDNEISDYLSGLGKEGLAKFSVVNYTGLNEDCKLDNNDNFKSGESMVLRNQSVIENAGNDFSMIEFSTYNLGEFGATEDIFSESILKEDFTDDKKARLSVTKINEIKPLKYLVLKSKDQSKWIKLGEITSDDFITDPIPFYDQTIYQLFYVDMDGTKKGLNTISIKTPEKKPDCFVFPNPIESADKINLYLSNFEANHFKINDVIGRDIPIENFKTADSHQEIRLKNELASGVYVITATDKGDKKCQAKFVKN